eukprot:XP_011671525.1 PREDICTED: uncharacterized protein LOC105441778 [Strongylocentrotus purpuratus]
MATSALELFLIALVYIVQTETNAQVIPLPVELHTTVYLPCSCPICPESTSGVQWYRSSNQNTFIQDGEALAWWSEGITGGSQGFGIKDDFSMTIVSVNLIDQHEQELYRCIVTPYGGAAECEHDVKLELYAKPESSPVIKYIRHNNGFNVTCSISNVFPMTFPIFTTKEGKRTASNNSDGTYNTAVTHLFPANEKDTTIECLYSALNFKSIASLGLFIVDDDILGQPEDENTTEKNKTHTNFRHTPSGLWMVWINLTTEVIFFIIIIVYAIKTGRVLFISDEHHGENGKEEETAKSTWNMLFGKLSCAVTLTIKITLLIILVAYLATTRCSFEAGGH